MTKSKNSFGQYVIKADSGKYLTDGNGYTKMYISNNDIDTSRWSEVEESDIELDIQEMTETEEKAVAYDILMGVSE